jgi:hypothetical protein
MGTRRRAAGTCFRAPPHQRAISRSRNTTLEPHSPIPFHVPSSPPPCAPPSFSKQAEKKWSVHPRIESKRNAHPPPASLLPRLYLDRPRPIHLRDTLDVRRSALPDDKDSSVSLAAEYTDAARGGRRCAVYVWVHFLRPCARPRPSSPSFPSQISLGRAAIPE